MTPSDALVLTSQAVARGVYCARPSLFCPCSAPLCDGFRSYEYEGGATN